MVDGIWYPKLSDRTFDLIVMNKASWNIRYIIKIFKGKRDKQDIMRKEGEEFTKVWLIQIWVKYISNCFLHLLKIYKMYLYYLWNLYLSH